MLVYSQIVAIMREVRKGEQVVLSVNTNKLRGKIAEEQITQERLARMIDMNPATFYRKMQADGLAFTIGQMHKLAEVLHMSADEAANIFLCKDSQ